MGNGGTSDSTTLGKVFVNASTTLTDISAVYSYGIREIGGFFAIATNGDLYVWGRSSSNHVFNGTTSNGNITYATKINNQFNNEAVARIWTTSHDRREIFVQTSSGLIYGTGIGYALGINSTSNVGWKLIDHFNRTTKYLVEMYTDGGATTEQTDTTTFAITRNINTDRYTLWGTGYNGAGRLGNGNDTNLRIWIKVDMPSHIVRMIRRIIVNTNGQNSTTILLLNNGRLLFAGRRVPLFNDTTIYNRFQPLPFSNMLTTDAN
jgi:hypothetical protein